MTRYEVKGKQLVLRGERGVTVVVFVKDSGVVVATAHCSRTYRNMAVSDMYEGIATLVKHEEYFEVLKELADHE